MRPAGQRRYFSGSYVASIVRLRVGVWARTHRAGRIARSAGSAGVRHARLGVSWRVREEAEDVPDDGSAEPAARDGTRKIATSAPAAAAPAATSEPWCTPVMNAYRTASAAAPCSEAGKCAAVAMPATTDWPAACAAAAGRAQPGQRRDHVRAVTGVQHRADDRDAERAADLAGGVVDGRAGAGLRSRQRAHDRLGGRAGGEGEAGRHQRHRADDPGPVRAAQRRSAPPR